MALMQDYTLFHKRYLTPGHAWLGDMRRWYDAMPPMHPVKKVGYMLTEETTWAVTAYRLGQWLLSCRTPVARGFCSNAAHLLRTAARLATRIDLPPTARIGPGLYIGHAGCTFLHADVRLGSNCSLAQECTIGVGGMGERRGVPVLGDCVFVSAGAKIFGKITIGDYVLIRPNAVLSRSVPPFSIVGGNPASVTGTCSRADVERLIFGERAAPPYGKPLPDEEERLLSSKAASN